MTGKHRDGEQNPLERAQFSEDEDKVVADGTSHADQGKKKNQAKVGMDLGTSQVTGRHFVRLPTDRQQRGATARSTDRGGEYPIQADFGGKIGNSNNSTSHYSPGCETTNRPATERDDVDEAKQAV